MYIFADILEQKKAFRKRTIIQFAVPPPGKSLCAASKTEKRKEGQVTSFTRPNIDRLICYW